MEIDGPAQLQGGMTLPALANYYRELKRDLLKKKDGHYCTSPSWNSFMETVAGIDKDRAWTNCSS